MRLYKVEDPGELRSLAEHCKEGHASLDNLATVWSSARRRGMGRSPWDGKVMVSFRHEGGQNIATVARISLRDELKEVAALKYTAALQWCRGMLREIRD